MFWKVNVINIEWNATSNIKHFKQVNVVVWLHNNPLSASMEGTKAKFWDWKSEQKECGTNIVHVPVCVCEYVKDRKQERQWEKHIHKGDKERERVLFSQLKEEEEKKVMTRQRQSDVMAFFPSFWNNFPFSVCTGFSEKLRTHKWARSERIEAVREIKDLREVG